MSPGYLLNLKMSHNDLVAVVQRMDRTFATAETREQEDMAEHLKVVVLEALSEFSHAIEVA